MFIGKALGVDDYGNFKAMRLIRKVGKSISVIEIRDRDEQEPIRIHHGIHQCVIVYARNKNVHSR